MDSLTILKDSGGSRRIPKKDWKILLDSQWILMDLVGLLMDSLNFHLIPMDFGGFFDHF